MQQTIQRPRAVAVLAVIAIVLGVIDLLGSFVYLDMTGANLGFALVNLLLAVAFIIFGIGAWTLQRWAWSVGVLTAAAWILAQVAYLYLFQGYTVVNLVIVGIVPAVMLYYLITPEAKKAFGQV